MANLSPAILILIAVACAFVALLIGYFLGSRFGGKKSVAVKEATEKHDSYKNDVREHFEQTSAIMSRMVDDYRDMYRHMAQGADKLAEMHPEKLVTPPPAPESITRDTAVDAPKADDSPASQQAGDSKTAASAKSGDKPADKSAATSDNGAQSRDAAAKGSQNADKATAADGKKQSDTDAKAGAGDKSSTATDKSAKSATDKASSGENSGSNSQAADKSSNATDKPAGSRNTSKRYGLE